MPKLTMRFVATTKRQGLHGDGGNLFLKVDGRSKSWVVRAQRDGKLRTFGLGPIHTVGLADARARAAEIRKQLLDGIDPRRAAIKTITFGEAAERYIESHKAGWRTARHAQRWRSTLHMHAEALGALPVNVIDVASVLQVLTPLWSTRTSTAKRCRSHIEAVLAWAKVHGYRQGENPAAWRGNLDQLLPSPSKLHKTQHHNAMPYAQVPAFMAELRTCDGIAARGLEFTVLTAARTGEVLGAKWSELDLAARTWTIPAVRMKSNREHRVPLCDRAVAILDGLPHSTDLVFPGRHRRLLAPMTFLRLLHRMGYDGLTGHGFRSAFNDWAIETTSFQREAIEAALAHAVGDRTEAAYRRGDLIDKRRQLMNAWDAYCGSRVASNVVNFR